MNVKALMRTLPGKVRVGPYDFRLVQVPPTEGRHGYFSSAKALIEVEGEPADCVMAVDNLLHEIAHAIHWAFALKKRDPEERLVTLTASAWTQIHRDNPWLLPWMQKGLGHA